MDGIVVSNHGKCESRATMRTMKRHQFRDPAPTVPPSHCRLFTYFCCEACATQRPRAPDPGEFTDTIANAPLSSASHLTACRPNPRTGGRQIDGAISSLRALERIMKSPRVRDAQARGAFTVMLDSGVRTGSDVFRAIALGAQAELRESPSASSAAVPGCSDTAR